MTARPNPIITVEQVHAAIWAVSSKALVYALNGVGTFGTAVFLFSGFCRTLWQSASVPAGVIAIEQSVSTLTAESVPHMLLRDASPILYGVLHGAKGKPGRASQ